MKFLPRVTEEEKAVGDYSTPRRFATLLGLSLFVALFCQADTTQYPPVRGQNTISISKAPPLPKSTNVCRIERIHDQYFILRDAEPNTIIFSPNKPNVEPTATGWRITF